MKSMTILSSAVAILMLAGCSGSSDDTADRAESNLKADEEPGGVAGCFSVRDQKSYDVGSVLVGKHDAERCPPTVRVCLAPDSNYSSECRADGTWSVIDNGFASGM